MQRATVVGLALIGVFALAASAYAVTFAWNYNRLPLDLTVGFLIYMGDTADDLPTVIADIPKDQVTIQYEDPFLVNETFDTDPGTKYNVTRGSWQWVEETKNMKVTGPEFMVVFEEPAGTTNDFMLWFWPEKATGDQPQLYLYIKDEAASTNGGVYYELRFGSSSGVRYSNFRKVYDQKYGGVDPNGAFPLPRYPQCTIIEGQNNICSGFWINVGFSPGPYNATIYDQAQQKYTVVGGVDARALDINKLEIIIKEQTGWIDNIAIGGGMELRKTVEAVGIVPGKYFAVSAYNTVGESEKSPSVMYEGGAILVLPALKNLRHIESGG